MGNKFSQYVQNRAEVEQDSHASTGSSGPNLSEYLKGEEGRRGRNKTFYLDEAVIKALKEAASSANVTESKLVNSVLKKILLT